MNRIKIFSVGWWINLFAGQTLLLTPTSMTWPQVLCPIRQHLVCGNSMIPKQSTLEVQSALQFIINCTIPDPNNTEAINRNEGSIKSHT